VDHLPEVFPVRFVLVGRGNDSRRIQKILSTIKRRDKIITTGYQPDAIEYMASFDVYVQSSLSEGVSRSVVESLCLGVPVVATAVGGTPELIEENVSGILVPPKDPKAIANAILRISKDINLIRIFSREGKKRIEGPFSIGKTIQDTISVYRKVLRQ
jgi:glycosyltransferase involved in cell wall biosynthesis